MPSANEPIKNKRLLGWLGIVAVVMVTASVMLGASAVGLAKSPTQATLEEEDTSSSADTPAGPSTATVDVILAEWSIAPSVSSIKAGVVTFDVKNEGPDRSHECIILKTEIRPDALPTLGNHSLNEDGDGITSPGESHVLKIGEKQEVKIEMTPGHYVFVDNITEDGTIHWEKKAYAEFTVTP